MIQILESPNEIVPKSPIKLFLAGGITGVSDWQSEIIERLMKDSENKIHDYLSNVIIYNPRRQKFPIHIIEESYKQITWEYNKLKNSDVICFWFASGSLNPIVLFEYGKFITNNRVKIIVGIDPDYERKIDVEIQTKLERSDININYNIVDFYYNILTELKKLNK